MFEKYRNFIKMAHVLVGEGDGDNPEYERGMAELILIHFPILSDAVDTVISHFHKGDVSYMQFQEMLFDFSSV